MLRPSRLSSERHVLSGIEQCRRPITRAVHAHAPVTPAADHRERSFPAAIKNRGALLIAKPSILNSSSTAVVSSAPLFVTSAVEAEEEQQDDEEEEEGEAIDAPAQSGSALQRQKSDARSLTTSLQPASAQRAWSKRRSN